MTLDPNDRRVTEYVFDELDESQRAAFEAELQQSGELQQLVEDLSRMRDALRSGLDAEPEIGLAVAQKKQLKDQIESGSTTMASRQVPWKFVAAFLAVAGSLVCVAVLVWPDRQLARDAAQRESAVTMRTEAPRELNRALAGRIAASEDSESRYYNATMPEEKKPDDALSEPHPDGQSNLKSFSIDAGNKELPLAKPSHFADGSVGIDFTEEERARPQVAMLKQAGGEAGYGAVPVTGTATPPATVAAANPVGGGLGAAGQAPRGAGPGVDFYGQDADLGLVVPGTGGEGRPDGRGRERDAIQDLETQPGEGRGPGEAGDRYDFIVENPFLEVKNEPLSTFSIDVDTASYSKVRNYLMQFGQLPRRDAVRIEELLNYFPYDYAPPTDEHPFAAHMELAQCPWNDSHRLLRVALKGRVIENEERPFSNLVFLLDVSGSMNQPNKLPLLKQGMQMLVDQLSENDQVAIVVYAGAAGLVLDSTNGDQKETILTALERLRAGGSTNGGEGIQLAYQMAMDHFIQGGVNRVVLCTDGDFNVGTTGTDQLVQIAEQNAKSGVFLSVLGFGMDNHNDAMLEQLSNRGNGNYAFIDSQSEARKVLVEQMSGTLVTIAKDVKIQIEFNPRQIAAYRLIGYENRILAAEDFNDDKKDAGEIGAGHTVTALYELVPSGVETDIEARPVDDLKYQTSGKLTRASRSGEALTLKLRYKQPDGDTSQLVQFTVTDEEKRFGDTSKDYRFAAAVAGFGMLLRDSQYKGNISYDAVAEIASEAASEWDPSGYRAEFLQLVTRAKQLSGK